ncbi:MAG: FtsX-like permease family protein [Bacillota bacterium]|nr:FtsX-like permease family protein [Bacillota bacterium]
MLLHILKKDLKRKRTMNVVLLLFITMATTFLASSVNNLITIQGAVDSFLRMAKTPDLIILEVGEGEKAPIWGFLENCEYVTEYDVYDMHTLMDDEIEIVSCALVPEKHGYEKGNTVSVGTVPDNFMKVFDEEGNPFVLGPGEAALPSQQAQANDLQTGDILKISCEGKSKEFTVKTIVKDAVFGSQYMGFKRIFISEEDYDWLYKDAAAVHTLLYGVNYSDKEAFTTEFNKNNFQVISSIDGSIVRMCYVFDMLIAGILIVVSICLILISFLILRFTIVFTLQEDYKEIGVMKAIGIRDISIKGIYLLKYFAIAVLGAAAGLGFSLPFEKLLLSQTMTNLVVDEVESKVQINMFCAVAIILIVLLFCYSSTGKVKKYTAIEAIRNGGNGERYTVRNLLRLHKRKRMPSFVYMAANDVISNRKRYLVLALIFCLGTLLILIPLKAIHTLEDKDIIRTFALQSSSVFIDTGGLENYVMEKDNSLLTSELNEMKEILSEHGLEAEVWIEMMYSVPCYGDDPEKLYTYFTAQQLGRDEDDYDVIEGKVPVLPNEVMVTEASAKELGVEIGDTVYYQYADRVDEFLVTGIYQTMMNMGKGLHVSKNAEIAYSYLSGLMGIQVEIDSDLEDEEIKEQLQKVFSDYEIDTCSEHANSMTGDVQDQLGSVQLLIVGVVLFINIMITVLTMKTLITRERGEIAMLKSIGFSDKTLKGWQSTRILLVLCAAIFLGALLSGPLSSVTLGPIFAMMGGTNIKLITRPLEAYVIYPLIMLAVTGLAAYLCANEVKKVELKEINTIE